MTKLFGAGVVLGINQQISQLENVLEFQNPGPLVLNPLKHAIKAAVASGVSVDTIVLLLLLPLVATIIAGARHLIGLRGFGIFLPAALSVVFLATGPLVGMGLFLMIVITSTLTRLILRKLKIKLQYLPRMALILWAVVVGVLGVLFTQAFFKNDQLANVSIFPVLIMALLAEDFTKVQVGKSVKIALSLTSETLILALVSFTVLSLEPVQYFALLNPEILLLSVLTLDLFLGRYVGLRLIELWRFMRLIKQ